MSTDKEIVKLDAKLYYLLPIRCFLFVMVFAMGSIIVKKNIEDISNWWSIVASLINIIVIGIMLLAARKYHITYAKIINFEKSKTKISQVVLVTLSIFLLGFGGMYGAGYLCYGKLPYLAPMMIAPIPITLAAVNVLVLPITTALAEDGLYLGCGVNSIKSKWTAIFLPAFFFALQHCFIPTIFDWRYIAYRFLSFLPLTILMCWWYYKNRNPLPFMIGHALIDVATVVQILITSAVPGLYETMCGL